MVLYEEADQIVFDESARILESFPNLLESLTVTFVLSGFMLVLTWGAWQIERGEVQRLRSRQSDSGSRPAAPVRLARSSAPPRARVRRGPA